MEMEVVETCGEGTLSSAGRSLASIDEEVVGFEKDAESIIKKLIGGTKELDVNAIFGMPGLGKTTLARKVYNNPSIVNHFDAKAATVHREARSLSQNELHRYEADLQRVTEERNSLKLLLRQREEEIKVLRSELAKAYRDQTDLSEQGEDGSRVMVTTLIEQVAKHLQHHSDPYSLRFLTLEESWELLHKKVFQGESCPPNLLEAGLQVSEHCKGLPLVIVLIAGIIVKMERQASFWLEVANDLSSHALDEQSMKVRQSSYEHLDDHLKPCLLYMGLFPEDYKIPVSALLKLWMAEEFVVNVDTENYMEEAGRVCLNDLLNRSLVMVSKRRRNGHMKYCILHDVVREFCLAKLREEKFMQLTMPNSPYKHLYYKESRLCIYIHDDLVEQLDYCEYKKFFLVIGKRGRRIFRNFAGEPENISQSSCVREW
ncbi:putative late blight resistance protein homolog R1C-3 [Nicotiana tabacum]|uniref:Late blight resistance protein homolog R1C-3 n=1 Tax=Nicotiana tabacum TaxID=4097 RepID=A0AC58TNU7_TOBAC